MLGRPKSSPLRNHISWIVQLRSEGYSAPAIAEQLETKGVYVSHETVSSFCKKLRDEGYKIPILNPGRKSKLEPHHNEIIRLHEEGLNNTKIHNALKQQHGLNTTPSSIGWYIRKHKASQPPAGSCDKHN